MLNICLITQINKDLSLSIGNENDCAFNLNTTTHKGDA